MPCFICVTCGTQYAATEEPPKECTTCSDPRQYVGHNGQEWVTHEQAVEKGYKNVLREVEPGVLGIGIEPKLGIGQRALLFQTPKGNVLWDCVSLLDDAAFQEIKKLGGIAAIVISHPHFYCTMVDWAERFDCPIYLHADDKQWVMRPSDRIEFWEGEYKDLFGGLKIIRLGGHFPGSCIIHWWHARDGKSVVGSADTILVAADLNYATFMYSYPNYIPLPAKEVARIRKAVEQIAPFDRLYSNFWVQVMKPDAKRKVLESADRYVKILEGDLVGTPSGLAEGKTLVEAGGRLWLPSELGQQSAQGTQA